MSWSAEFDDPIELPEGRKLLTLCDAASQITKLPKAEHTMPAWQAAMEPLILLSGNGGPMALARIGVMRALDQHRVQEFNPDRKDTHWGKTEAETRPVRLPSDVQSVGMSQVKS